MNDVAGQEKKAELPGYWALLWLLFMQPMTLHRRLLACNIKQPNRRVWHLWGGNGIQRDYVKRMLILVMTITPALAIAGGGISYMLGLPVPWKVLFSGVLIGLVSGLLASVTRGMAIGVTGGIAAGIAAGVTVGVVGGVALGVAKGIAEGVTSAGVAFGGILGIATSLVVDVAIRVANGQGEATKVGAIGGITVGVAGGIAVGLARGPADGEWIGIALGLSFIATYFRFFPFYPFEAILAITLYLAQLLFSFRTLRFTPVLHHELSYLPQPFLAAHIVLAADSDSTLARRVVDACAVSPGQQRAGRSALARLQAGELERFAHERNFSPVAHLLGEWLPGVDGAAPLLLAYREVALYLQAAQGAHSAYHKLAHLEKAEKELKALDNRLLGERSPLARELRITQRTWFQVIAELHQKAESAAADEVPNPFRAGLPLGPDQGGELFRGREGLVARIGGLLANSDNAASLALLGPRRCGKTSLLKMLPTMLPDTVVVFFDLQDNPVHGLATFFSALDERALEQARRDRRVELPELDRSRLETAPFETARAWLEALETAMGERRLLFCIDEFERLESLFAGERRELVQFMGLLRATIQHRRRVRLLVAGAAPFEEWGELWNDHFINVHEIRIGHLERETTVGLLTRPFPSFPSAAIPSDVAEEVFARTGGQPYLVQLYGSLLVARLNDDRRSESVVADVEAVEGRVLEEAAYYLGHAYRAAPPPAQAALTALAQGQSPDMDPHTRRWLGRRALIDGEGHLTMPVLGRWIREEEL